MRQMTLSEAVRTLVTNQDFQGEVTHFDPVEEVYTLQGVSHYRTGPDVIVKKVKSLAFFGIEVVYTEEERKMVAEAKLTHQVAVKAADLLATIKAWINRPGGR